MFRHQFLANFRELVRFISTNFVEVLTYMIKIVFKIEIEVLKSSTLVYAIYIYFTYTLM